MNGTHDSTLARIKETLRLLFLSTELYDEYVDRAKPLSGIKGQASAEQAETTDDDPCPDPD